MLRHDLHQHPEIRFEESWTSDRIAQFLEAAGIPCRRGLAKGTGLVATIQGARDGGTVALRADMDALEIQEETELPHASTIPNRMHACGHDGHMACLCGAAKALQAVAAGLPGRVKLIFQPAEEMAAGGRLLAEAGVLDDVDAVFALHGWPSFPIGSAALRPGCLMAGAREFRIIVQGKGCHGADPASGVDPIVAAAHIITALQTLVSRETNPWEAAVASVGFMQAGTASNIIPPKAELRGTLRALNNTTLDRLAASLDRLARETARAFRATAATTFPDEPYPPLFNDPEMTEIARQVIRDNLGPDRCIDLESPIMVAEDFAFYLQRVPGAFLLLGTRSPGEEAAPPLHSPLFDFPDAALPTGITLLASLADHILRGAAHRQATPIAPESAL